MSKVTMKNWIQKASVGIVGFSLVLSVLMGGMASATTNVALTLSPASGSYTVGNNLSVGVYEDSGSGDCSITPRANQPDSCVNAIQANLSYSSSLLTYLSITSSSAWSNEVQSTGGGGTVQITRSTCGTCPPDSGYQLVATVNFKIAAAGTATISYASGTAVARNNDNGANTVSTTGGSYTLAAVPSPPPSPTPSPSPSPSSSHTSNPTPPASSGTKTSPSPPASSTTSPAPSPSATSIASMNSNPYVSDVKVTNLSPKSATISWSSSVATTSEVDYGVDTNYGLTAVDSTLTTNHSLALKPSQLKAGAKYHFLVRGADASGNVISGADSTFVLSTTVAKKSASSGKVIAAAVVVGLLAAGGIGFFMTGGSIGGIGFGGPKPQWSGFEPPAGSVKTSTNYQEPPAQVITPGSVELPKPGSTTTPTKGPGSPK